MKRSSGGREPTAAGFVGHEEEAVREVQVPAPRTGCPNGSSTGNHDESSTGTPIGMPVSSMRAAGTVAQRTPPPLCHFVRTGPAAAAGVRRE